MKKLLMLVSFNLIFMAVIIKVVYDNMVDSRLMDKIRVQATLRSIARNSRFL